MTWDKRQNVSDEEVNERFKLIEENSGKLSIGGTLYSNVNTKQIILIKTLGNGTCGTVNKVKLGNRTMAEKEMKRTDNKEETKRIFMDLDVIRRSNDCPFIVKCYGYIITEDHLKIYMELMACCAEKLLIERGYVRLPEEIIGKITLSVTQALIFLKDTLSLMHRDIKPSNILLDWHGNVKLCDFGISGQLIDSNAASMSTGCIGYLAPERTDRQPYKANADVWSLGITLVHLAWGIYPYQRIFGQLSSPFELMIKIKETPPPKLNPQEGFTDEFCSFVEQCLNREPAMRPKFTNLLELPFLVRAQQDEQTDVGHWLVNQNEYLPPPAKPIMFLN